MPEKTATEREIDAVQAEIDAKLPAAVERLTPILLAAGGKRSLADAPLHLREQIAAEHDPEIAALLKRAHDLNLRWNIEEGLY